MSREFVTFSFFFASTARAVWYFSEKYLSLSAKKMARSRFFIIKSVAVNHLCSKHSSADGRFLNKYKTKCTHCFNIRFALYLQWCTFEDIHQPSCGFWCYFLIKIFKSITSVGDIGVCFIVINSSEWTCCR